MPIYQLGDWIPQIDPSAFVHETAVLIGQVSIGPNASVWPFATIRGDNEPISVGQDSNCQEGCTLHADPGFPQIGRHTSELQSRRDLVCRLLLEKKKKKAS